MNAVAAWDLAAHRALASTATPATLATVARGQAMTSRTAQVLLHAAAQMGRIEPQTYAVRLAPPLEASTRAWGHLARQSDALTQPGARRIDSGLLAADAELQAASRELIHDGAHLAAPERIAGRVDLSAVGLVLSEAINSGVDVSHAVSDAAAHPGFTAPAQVMLTAARKGAFGLGPGELTPLGDLFTPRDLRLNRSVPLVEPIRAALARSGAAAMDAVSTASSAMSALGSPARAASNDAAREVPERRVIHPLGATVPVPGGQDVRR